MLPGSRSRCEAKMGFAEDKVYEYIRENMSDFHHTRVLQLIRHLPCLSDADREEIEAYDDRKGNEFAVWKLFDYLKCRSGWVKELIEALRKNRHHDLADRVQCEYDAHQVCPRSKAPLPAVNNSLPSYTSVCSQMPPPTANPDPWCTGPTSANNPHMPALPRQPASLPGSGAPLPPQTNPSGAESCHDLGEYNTPVQEMEPMAKQKVTEDALTPWREAPSSQPTGNAALADLRASQEGGNHGDGLAPAAVRLSPGSPAGHLLASGVVPREEVEVAQPSRPVPDSRGQSQDWAGRQQHPVCVSGGYFGNMNHLNVGNSRKTSMPGEPVQRGEPAAAPSPEDFKNQPEEVYFSSLERSPLASSVNRAVHGDGQQPGDSLREQKIQALQGYENGNLTSSMVDVRDPVLLHTQFDAEQKRTQGQRDHGGERDVFPLHQIPTDLSEDVTAHDLGALHLGTICSASSSEKLASRPSSGPSQRIPEQNPDSGINSHHGGRSGGCLADTLGVASGLANSRDPQSKVQIPTPVPHVLCPTSTPGPSNVLPTSSPIHPSTTSINRVLKLSNAMPAVEFPDLSGFSSTAVIPPSSPALPSDPSGPAFNSDLGELKSPIQERELPMRETDSSSSSMPKENANQVPKPPAPSVTRTSPGILGNTAGTTTREAEWETQNTLPDSPGGCQAFYNELDEEVELSKPGVLISTGGMEEPAKRQPESSETHVQYSGRSDRFVFSGECSQDSNPLMISESSSACSNSSRAQRNQPEENHYFSRSDHRPAAWAASNDPRRDEATKTSRASLPPESSSTWDSTAVGTHEVHVVEYPSADLEEAPDLRVVANAYENPSPASSGSLRRFSEYSNSPWNSEAPPESSPQNDNRPRRDSDGTSFPLKDYILPAAVAAFTSVVAFLFYKHLRN
ncbi:mitochondrial antiviral-signaling protein isoform X1 [Gopherus flavomarginatus]|uniref:mitochondrial antiviral-signaling protein isoform X1 n=2 Tax=Gopherus flavomarginatus TaxID=286002 RepID=UPI0021CBC12E|nr:mitochondrial antiviral-signaling protein isoform X1 [Gopherus flavomarginatus]